MNTGGVMNKTVLTAILALTVLLVFFTACGAPKEQTQKEAPAVEEASKMSGRGTSSAKKDGSRTGISGRKSTEEPAREDSKTNEDEKEENETEQPLPDDHMEREKTSRKQVWESEDGAENDHEEEEKTITGEKERDIPPGKEHENTHVHDWVEQTEIIHHDETGHYEEVNAGTRTVVDEEAYDEPVYQTKCICSACGFEADSTDEIVDHLDSHYDAELGYIDASYSVERVVTDIVHHPEVSHEEPIFDEEWIVDREAWDETVVTGYMCRTCGAVK